MDKGTSEKVTPELFSEEERTSLVRSFLESYLRGTVRIEFPTANEFRQDSEFLTIARKSNDLPNGSPTELEIRIKEQWSERIAIATGTKEATVDERNKALNDVFNDLVTWRNSRRVLVGAIRGSCLRA